MMLAMKVTILVLKFAVQYGELLLEIYFEPIVE